MTNRDPLGLYAALLLTPDATAEQIKKAHRRRVRELHPDNQETGDVDAFNLVQHAYEILSNPDARDHYDLTGDTRGFGRTADERDMRAREMLISYFNQAIQECKGAFVFTNLITLSRKIVLDGIKEGRTNIVTLKGEIAMGEKLLKRIKHVGKGEDTISKSIRVDMDNARADIKRIEEAIKDNELAVKILRDEYSYVTGEDYPGWTYPGEVNDGPVASIGWNAPPTVAPLRINAATVNIQEAMAEAEAQDDQDWELPEGDD